MMERILISSREVDLIRRGIQKGVIAPERENTNAEVLLHCPDRNFLAVAQLRRVAHVNPWDIAAPVFAHEFDPMKLGMNKTRILHLSNAGLTRVRILAFQQVIEYEEPKTLEELTLYGEAV